MKNIFNLVGHSSNPLEYLLIGHSIGSLEEKELHRDLYLGMLFNLLKDTNTIIEQDIHYYPTTYSDIVFIRLDLIYTKETTLTSQGLCIEDWWMYALSIGEQIKSLFIPLKKASILAYTEEASPNQLKLLEPLTKGYYEKMVREDILKSLRDIQQTITAMENPSQFMLEDISSNLSNIYSTINGSK